MSELDPGSMQHTQTTVGASLNRIILYARDVDISACFYSFFFGFKVVRTPTDRLTELVPENGGAHLLLHRAGKAQKLGQASVKLVFDVEDVQAFRKEANKKGLKFGPVHKADGYSYSNAKDPDGNSVQVSSRAYRDQNKGK
ncbi:VOC family protein [uncultured Roseibium sp.]|uniref:VOC family protein n=1 Tax=uncultured Roseibium sp. TaxID=1936171 RepID=UPI00261E6EC8|nr:VOC family protein [uncultured Roseibium sp.]